MNGERSGHTFQVEVIIVKDGLAPKRVPKHLRMGIVITTDGLSAEFVVECILGWEAGLNEAVPWVHVLLWFDLLPEKEIELVV